MGDIKVTYTGKAKIDVVLDCVRYAASDRSLAKFWREMADMAQDDATRDRRNRYARREDRSARLWLGRAERYAAGKPVRYR